MPPARPSRPRPDAAPPGVGTLSRDSERPLYLQLAALLAERIAAGDPGPGQRLPTEPQLMAAYGVSRITVRQALAVLARNGQLVARRGKGTFVASPVMRHDLGALRGFYDALREQGLEPQMELLEFSPSAGGADPDLPAGLRLPVRLRRRYRLEGAAFAIVEAWLPAAAAALGAARASQLMVYEILERFLGERVAAADLTIRSQRVSTRVARELALPRGSAILVMERLSSAASGRPLEFMRIHIVAERYEFRLRVPGPLEIASSVRQSSVPQSRQLSQPRRP